MQSQARISPRVVEAAHPPRPAVVAPQPPVADEAETRTRERVLRLVVSAGPISAAELAAELSLTSAAVRRHIAALESAGEIVVRQTPAGQRGRGRPARRYVATARGQTALGTAYSALAGELLDFLLQVGGEQAASDFASARVEGLEARYADAVAQAGPDVGARVEALAGALAADGYAATARPVGQPAALQLCQGHCPVQDIAARFPELCEAESRAFSRLLGVHVQRLSTLASGAHACTTHVPHVPLAAPTPTRNQGATAPAEGTR